MISCGIDWAAAHHDVALVDAEGKVLARSRIGADVGGFTALAELIAEHGGGPAETPIAIETDKNLLVVALAGAGFTVYPINPRAVAHYRERHAQAGGKSDPGDAMVQASILRTDLHLHRPLSANTEQALAVKTLARQHQEAIWAMHQTINRLRSVLLEFYPQAVKAFPKLKHHAATTVLAAAPSPAAATKLTRRRGEALLHRCRRRNDTALVDQILSDLKTPSLRQPERVEAALGQTVQGLVDIIDAMRRSVDMLEAELTREFDAHPLAAVLRSAPGLGQILGARMLAEVGDDPERFTSVRGVRAFAGTAPVTRASGRSHYVKARRKVRYKRLGDACHWWAFSSLTRSPGARAQYDRRRAAGDHHNAALRNVANKLIGRMWWCLANNEPWDDSAAWPSHSRPQERGAA